MKNNKVLTGILLIVVIGIWAKVFLKISDNFDSEIEAQTMYETNSDKIVLKERDKFSLSFSGIDPFLKSSPKGKPINKTSEKNSQVKALPKRNVINWPSFQYYGFVKGTKKKSKLAVLKAGSILMNLREGQTFFEGFKIKRAYRDSIVIVFGKNHKTVYKK